MSTMNSTFSPSLEPTMEPTINPTLEPTMEVMEPTANHTLEQSFMTTSVYVMLVILFLLSLCFVIRTRYTKDLVTHINNRLVIQFLLASSLLFEDLFALFYQSPEHSEKVVFLVIYGYVVMEWLLDIVKIWWQMNTMIETIIMIILEVAQAILFNHFLVSNWELTKILFGVMIIQIILSCFEAINSNVVEKIAIATGTTKQEIKDAQREIARFNCKIKTTLIFYSGIVIPTLYDPPISSVWRKSWFEIYYTIYLWVLTNKVKVFQEPVIRLQMFNDKDYTWAMFIAELITKGCENSFEVLVVIFGIQDLIERKNHDFEFYYTIFLIILSCITLCLSCITLCIWVITKDERNAIITNIGDAIESQRTLYIELQTK